MQTKNTDMQHLIEAADMISTPAFAPRHTASEERLFRRSEFFGLPPGVPLGLRLTGAELSHTSYVENYQRLFVIFIS